MLVSHFELLVTRIGPTIPGPVGDVYRNVAQGYFLTVSNLEPTRTLSLFLKFTQTTATGHRVLSASNAIGVFDNGNSNDIPKTVFSFNSAGSSGSNTIQSFTLAPKQTCLIAILPKVDIAAGVFDTEIRGFVEIKQTQSFLPKASAQVLLTAEYRGTYLDKEYPSANPLAELDFDQLAYAVPLASGQALNTVEAVPGFAFDRDFLAIDYVDLIKQLKVKNPLATDFEIEEAAELISNMKDNKDLLTELFKAKK